MKMSSRNCGSKIKKQDVNSNHLCCNSIKNSGFIRSSISSDLISIIKENRQLKSMLLLHLDLIQEQSDQLHTKERLISNLRQENESLKLKIEDMGRRVFQKHSRIIATVNGNAVNNGASSKLHFRMNSTAKCETVQDVKLEFLPDIPVKEAKVNGLSVGKIVLSKKTTSQNMKPKRRLSETLANFIPKKSPKLSLMTTSKEYITRDWKTVNPEEDCMLVIGKRGALEINLEVPSWRIVHEDEEEDDSPELEAKAVREEEVQEDIYIKSHLKFEIDERRRKKWDVQRLREQRTIERLKRRHHKSKMGSGGELKASICPSSFYPSSSTIRFINITDELPVHAFGEVIHSLAPQEFTLPWIKSHKSPYVVLDGSEEADKWTVSSTFQHRMSGHTENLSKI